MLSDLSRPFLVALVAATAVAVSAVVSAAPAGGPADVSAGAPVDVAAGAVAVAPSAGSAAASAASPGSSASPPSQAPELAWFAHMGGSLYDHAELDTGDERFLFVSVGQRILVFDVTDAERPVRIGEAEEQPGPPIQMLARGSYLYTIVYRYGFCVFDVTDPAAPRLVGGLPGVGATALDLRLMGDTVILRDPAGGLVVIDVSEAEAPQLVDVLSFPAGGDPAESLELESLELRDANLALIAKDDTADPGMSRVLLILDASDPTQVAVVGRLAYRSGQARGIAWLGHQVYTSDGTGVFVFDASDLTAPQLAGHMPRPADGLTLWTLYRGAGGLYQTGQWSETNTSVLIEYDLTNPAEPMPIGVYDNGPWGRLRFASHRVYSISDNLGLIGLYDTRPSEAPVLRSEIQLPGSIGDVAVDDGLLYMLSSSGLLTAPVDDPHRLLGRWYMPWRGRRIAHDGERLYVAVGKSGLRTLDMTDPNSPRELEPLHPDRGVMYSIENMVPDGSRGYALVRVSRGPTELWVLDLEPAAGPELLGTVQVDIGWNRMPAFGASGDTVLIGSDYGLTDRELVSVDVSEPATPREMERQPIDEHVWWLEPGDGSTVYAGTDNAVLVLDAASPDHVFRRGRLGTADADGDRAVHGLAYDGDHLYALMAHPPPPGNESKGATLAPLSVIPPWGLGMRQGLEMPAWFRSGYALRTVVDGSYVVANGGAQGATIARWGRGEAEPTGAVFVPLALRP